MFKNIKKIQMKAKEYAEKYIPLFATCKSEEERKIVIGNLCKEFMKDIDNLKNIRHIVIGESLVSLLNEGSQKWKALCRLLPGKELNEFGFKNFWASILPEKYNNLIK